VLALAPLLMLAQCDDQKAANKANFKAALSKFFGQFCAVLSLVDPLTGMMGGLGVGGKPTFTGGGDLIKQIRARACAGPATAETASPE
jgi:hypothetical protein